MAAVQRPRAADQAAEPHISIVIPVYNEQAILHAAIVDLRERLKPLGWSYEIILAENGSKDRTVSIGHELAGKYDDPEDGQVKIISLGEPNYGRALKQGILMASGNVVLCDEIDLCDTTFHKRAVDILETGEADLVIGSKLAVGAADERPLIRHAAS
ncbi:MAG: glycosyltransferase, partial [Myxococcota bacterium]|nr:glycosyltransferase [Myxococcota bacterium]